MAFSYTGLAYLLGFFAVGLLTYRFFQYWQREKSTTSKLFFYLTGLFTLFMLITAVAGLFFARNIQILRWVVIFADFSQSFALAIIGYLIIYLKLPQVSPWWGFGVVLFLGMVTTSLNMVLFFTPFLEPTGGINWGTRPLIDISRLFLFLITFLPLIIILIQQMKTSEDPRLKTRAFGLSLVLIFGILVGLFDFALETILGLGAISSDIAMGALSIAIFILISLTQKPPSPEKEYIPPSFPKIPW